ncbi:MAG: DJ-1/PfpI family protein, partial [Demequina sp.]|uniref:DJ-1/PfpI family protein n=1 Tax=Demequina sp. TaxID=2050685 RepID=UPI003A871DC3
AARLQQRAGEAPGFDVTMVSPGGADVVAFGGMTLTSLVSPEDAGPFDVVVVPGTVDVAAATADTGLASAVAALVEGAGVTTAVCTGSFLLARAGVLDGLPATTHWEDVADLARERVADAVAGVRWVDAGSVVTSGGLTSGIHMALHVVARVAGEDLAHATARQLDMDWSATPER